MTETEEFKSLRRLALASLGRNVLHFQRLEFRFKLLLLISDYEGPPKKFAEFLKTRAKKLRKSSLGDLAEEWNAKFAQSGESSKPEKPLPNSHMALHFRAETGPEDAKAMKRELRALVAERNRLIHQDLTKFDPNSVDSCHELIAFLDEQNQRIVSQIKAVDQFRSAAAACFQAQFDSLSHER